MRPADFEQPDTSLITRCHGRGGEGCVRPQGRRLLPLSPATSWPLPGFQAYACNKDLVGEGRALPGFRAYSYRDWGHAAFSDRNRRVTGISGTPLPGFGPHLYREVGHGSAGTWGTNEPATTGILGIKGPAKPATRLGIPARNSVSNNSCNNTSTAGADFRVGGRGQ